MSDKTVGGTLKLAVTAGTLAEVLGLQSLKYDDPGGVMYVDAGINKAIKSKAVSDAIEPGTGSFSFYKDSTDTVHKLIQSSVNSSTRMDFEIVTEGGESRTGTGLLKANSTDHEDKGGVKISVEIELESIWTVTPAA